MLLKLASVVDLTNVLRKAFTRAKRTDNLSGERSLLLKVKGSITVQSTSYKSGLDMAVVDINKNYLFNPVN